MSTKKGPKQQHINKTAYKHCSFTDGKP